MRRMMFGLLALAVTGLGTTTSTGAATGTGLEAGALEFARGGPDRRSGEADPFKELRQQNKSKAKAKGATG